MQAEMEDMKDRKTAPPRSPPPAGDTHTQVGASCPLPAPAEAAEHDNSGLLSLPTQSYEKLVGKEGPAESEGKKNDTNETEVHLSQDASQSYSSGQAWSTLSPEDLTHWGGHMPSQGQPAPAAQAVPVTVTSTSRGTTRTRDRSSSPFLTAAEYMKMPKLGARVPLLSVVDAGRSAGQPPSWVPSISVPRPTCRGDSIPSLPAWTEVSTSPPSAWNANEGGRLPRSPAVPQSRASSPSPPRVQLAMLLRSPPAVTEVNASSPSPPPHLAVTDTDTITLSPSSLPEEVMQSANNYKCGHANELALRIDFTRACMLHCLRKHLTRNPHLREEETFSLPGDCLIEDIYNTRQIVITEHGLNQLKGIYPKDQRLIKTIYTVVSELPSLFAETKFRTSQKRSFELHLKVALATVSSTTLSAEEIRCVEFLRA
eukprot:CAMPEP_0113902030 /NCGR_PEP_ID=MMETSP0780_2-20120614/21605_1 /TAXON_ID=652834 /ORGANISM="Palpitomonas bilix" /LENGTH=426 /DNA_ID=CAMNT_0000894753 /DNA_START=199 /DNA_END=1479 /DNA_ORIENTATION=- /assembly_acc=CAM_ASM_000599